MNDQLTDRHEASGFANVDDGSPPRGAGVSGQAREIGGSAGTTDDSAYRLLLTIPQVCSALAVSRDAVYELLRSGRLPSVTFGRSRRIRIVDLELFVARLPRTAA